MHIVVSDHDLPLQWTSLLILILILFSIIFLLIIY
jgi:hypothetical protein